MKETKYITLESLAAILKEVEGRESQKSMLFAIAENLDSYTFKELMEKHINGGQA